MRRVWESIRAAPRWQKITGGVLGGVVVLAVLGAVVGDPESDSEKATKPADRPVPSQTRGEAFAKCINETGAMFKMNVPGNLTEQGRAPVRLPGPADYLGAAVQADGALFDFWIAGSPDAAQQMADLLNEAVAEREGVAETEAAFSNGIIVGALAVNGPPGDSDVAAMFDECSRQVSGL